MMISLRFLLLLAFLYGPFLVLAQVDSDWTQKPELTLSGFADVYYAYDFNRPTGTARQPFLFNHNRHNEFNLNLGLVKWAVKHPKYRANLALQTGTYANDNYVAEPGLLKNIFEANVGVSLSSSNNLWIDAGILPSHLGFESAISTENPTLTRSLLAENSPYFLSGARLTHTPSEKWELALLVVNGWQRIQRLEGNSLLSYGTQLIYRPDDKATVNWSTFIGTDSPDSTRQMRYFSNLYGIFRLSSRVKLIAAFDIGLQQRDRGSADYDLWLSPIVIGQYALGERWAMAFRAEYYQDETGIIVPTGTANGFQTLGLSFNLDYLPTQNLMWRIEGRWLDSEDAIFATNSTPTNRNFVIVSSLAIKFSDQL